MHCEDAPNTRHLDVLGFAKTKCWQQILTARTRWCWQRLHLFAQQEVVSNRKYQITCLGPSHQRPHTAVFVLNSTLSWTEASSEAPLSQESTAISCQSFIWHSYRVCFQHRGFRRHLGGNETIWWEHSQLSSSATTGVLIHIDGIKTIVGI